MSRTHTHILEVLRRELPALGENPVIMDVGCGDGGLIRRISTAHRCVAMGFDSPEYGLLSTDRFRESQLGGSEVSIRESSADGTWPFENDSADVLVSNQVLEHVFDIDQFCDEASRVSRPGAIGVHVFPTRHVIWEGHMHMPIVHRLRDHDVRSKLIGLLSRAGVGGYQTYAEPAGVELEDYSAAHADFLRTYTTYRTWPQLVDAFHRRGFRVSCRYTSMLIGQFLPGAPRPLPPFLEGALFPLTRMVSSITLFTENKQTYQSD